MDIRLWFARLAEENTKLRLRILELEEQLEGGVKTPPPLEDINEVYEYWNDIQIHQHNKLSEDVKQSIINAINKYGKEEVINAMNNYASVYYDEYYNFNKIYSLNNFPIEDFTDEGAEYIGYIKYFIKNKHKYI